MKNLGCLELRLKQAVGGSCESRVDVLQDSVDGSSSASCTNSLCLGNVP